MWQHVKKAKPTKETAWYMGVNEKQCKLLCCDTKHQAAASKCVIVFRVFLLSHEP